MSPPHSATDMQLTADMFHTVSQWLGRGQAGFAGSAFTLTPVAELLSESDAKCANHLPFISLRLGTTLRLAPPNRAAGLYRQLGDSGVISEVRCQSI
jgi:hypothetical protein